MTTAIKIIITIVILVIGTLLSAALNGGDASSRAPLFILIGVVAGVTAVWKYKPEKQSSSTDKQELDKS